MRNKEVITEARKRGFVTGSKVFGGYDRELSDIDIMVPYDFHYKFDDMLRICEGARYLPHSYRDATTTSIYIPLNNKDYNIIIAMDAATFRIWREATKILIAAVNASDSLKEVVYFDKQTRVDMFKTFRWTLGDLSLRLKAPEPVDQPSEDDIPF